MFDTKAEEFRKWEVPVAWTNPYDVILDSDGFAWGGGMTNDHVARVNTETDEITMYLLPGTTNIRRVDVDNSTSRHLSGLGTISRVHSFGLNLWSNQRSETLQDSLYKVWFAAWDDMHRRLLDLHDLRLIEMDKAWDRGCGHLRNRPPQDRPYHCAGVVQAR